MERSADSDLIRMRARKSSFHAPVNVNTATAARPGAESGSKILKALPFG